MPEDNVRKIWSEAELDAALSDLHDDTGDDDGLAFARASLMAATGTTKDAEEAPAPRRAGTWRWIAVAAAVVTLVGGLAVVTSLRNAAPEPSQPAAVSPDLDRPLAPGEYRYAQKLQWLPENLEGQPAEIQQKVELWIPADPTGIWHRRTRWTGAVNRFAPTGPQNVQLSLKPFDEYGRGGLFPGPSNLAGTTSPTWNTPFQNWLTPDAAFLASLTSDRAKLVKRLNFDTITLHDSGKSHTPTEALNMVRSVLETGLVRKDIRFGLVDAFAEIAGAFAVPGHTTDGRPATVLGTKDTGQRVYLDPATAQLLAWDANTVVTPRFVTTIEVATSSSGNHPPPSATSGSPSSSEPLATTTTFPNAPVSPQNDHTPETVYSFAITRSSE